MQRQKEPFRSGDLPITGDGRVLHLGISPQEISPCIIAVGDPGRPREIAEEFFAEVEVDRENRGLRTVTGITKDGGQRVSIVTHGMGAASTEIVMREITALFEIDFATREQKPLDAIAPITVIRLGTSGRLQESTPMGLPIVAEYAIGLESTGLSFMSPVADEFSATLKLKVRAMLNSLLPADSEQINAYPLYVSKATPAVVDAIDQAAAELNVEIRHGITATASGFFEAQGRDTDRVTPLFPDIDKALGSLDLGVKLKVENMEMELSYILLRMQALGHRAGGLCVTVADRHNDVFDTHYHENARRAAGVALAALRRLEGET